MRHFLRVDVLDRSADAGSTKRAEQEGHFVAFDQLPGLLHRLGRTVSIVIGDEVYLSAVDAAALVDRTDIGNQTLSGVAERRRGAAEWEGRSYRYLGFCDARRIRARLRASQRSRDRSRHQGSSEHRHLLFQRRNS